MEQMNLHGPNSEPSKRSAKGRTRSSRRHFVEMKSYKYSLEVVRSCSIAVTLRHAERVQNVWRSVKTCRLLYADEDGREAGVVRVAQGRTEEGEGERAQDKRRQRRFERKEKLTLARPF
jgi:hypothetical protein